MYLQVSRNAWIILRQQCTVRIHPVHDSDEFIEEHPTILRRTRLLTRCRSAFWNRECVTSIYDKSLVEFSMVEYIGFLLWIHRKLNRECNFLCKSLCTKWSMYVHYKFQRSIFFDSDHPVKKCSQQITGRSIEITTYKGEERVWCYSGSYV